jgi:toxin-antitoxin system PIN domain toxin
MPALCDANVLLALCHERHVHHDIALAWLNDQERRSVVLCRATQTTLLRLLTTRAVLGNDVCTLSQAWKIYDEILADERFAFANEPPGVELVWREYTRPDSVSPKLWQDAYLAAFAAQAGMELVTFDQGFRQFQDLTVMLL